MTDGRKRSSDDSVIKAWPWFGGMPGRAARGIFALWVILLVILAVTTLYAFVTLNICMGIALIFVVAIVGVAPTLLLVGSRI
jgi:uncharacterized membrane protein YhaH (DUF805 family)